MTSAKPPFTFTAQQGTFAKLGGELAGLSTDLSINLGSYNTPTNGSPYLSLGVGLSVGIGPVKIGFSYQQTSNNGGLSFVPSPTNFAFMQFNASNEEFSAELAPPQMFSGFTITANFAQSCTTK